MQYVHVRQEAPDREMERFEAQNISETKRWSGFGPVDTAEKRENRESTREAAGRIKVLAK
jgi:hypothetical protein